MRWKIAVMRGREEESSGASAQSFLGLLTSWGKERSVRVCFTSTSPKTFADCRSGTRKGLLLFNYPEHTELIADISSQTCCNFPVLVTLLHYSLSIRNKNHTHTLFLLYPHINAHIHMVSIDANALQQGYAAAAAAAQLAAFQLITLLIDCKHCNSTVQQKR